MPAQRSRTERWKDNLKKIRDRGGGLEFAIDRGDSSSGGKDLVWRVHLIDYDDKEMRLEHPGSMGQSFSIRVGTDLIGVMTIGQNKWMFSTRVVGVDGGRGRGRELRVSMPDGVERCMRRAHNRTSLGTIELPSVSAWPVLDPSSLDSAEVASRVLICELRERGGVSKGGSDRGILPKVGPRFEASLSNIGGGGVGLVVAPEHRSAVDGARLLWVSIDLRPSVPAPLSMGARVAHTHIDSQHNTYAGLAFEFHGGADHKGFVVGEIDRYLRGAQGTDRAAA